MEFDNKSFWKFTTALGKKLSDGRLFFTELFLKVLYEYEIGFCFTEVLRSWYNFNQWAPSRTIMLAYVSLICAFGVTAFGWWRALGPKDRAVG